MFKAYVWDLETTDLNTFMGRTIVASFLDLDTGEIETRTLPEYKKSVEESEKALLRWVIDRMEEADVLIGHNTLGFDVPFVRGRAAALNLGRTPPKRTHIDTMLVARYGFKGRPQGASMENLADFFKLDTQKYKPSKHDWAASRHLDHAAIAEIAQRCEEDVRCNAELWYKLRPYYHDWRGK